VAGSAAIVTAVHIGVVRFGGSNGLGAVVKIPEENPIFGIGKIRARTCVNFVFTIGLSVFVNVIVCHS
jgi:hypothetical protein